MAWQTAERFEAPPLPGVFRTLLNAETELLEQQLQERANLHKKGTVGRALAALLRHCSHHADVLCGAFLGHVEGGSRQSSKRRQLVGLFTWLLAGANGMLPGGGGPLVESLIAVVSERERNRKALLSGCLLMRGLVEDHAVVVQAKRTAHSIEPVDPGDFTTGEVTMEEVPCAELFTAAIPSLIHVVQTQSVKEGKRRMPTRLTLAAADCIIAITRGIIDPHKDAFSSQSNILKGGGEAPQTRQIIKLTAERDDERKGERSGTGISKNVKEEEEEGRSRRGERIWALLDVLVDLVKELLAWNEGERALYADGLKQVLLRLQSMAEFRDSVEQNQNGRGPLPVAHGAALIGGCRCTST